MSESQNGGGRRRARRDAPLRRRRYGRRRAAGRHGRDRAGQGDGRDGAVGLGQVDADAHPRGARQADVRLGRRSPGTEITTLGDNDLTKLRREHIGFVFQFFNLLPMLDAKENILLPLTIAGEKPDDAGSTSSSTDVGLADRLSHRPAELSGGQQQRVAIARALVSQADGALRGRADRQPRLGDERGDPRAAAPLGRRVRPDDRHGDARRARSRRRASRPLPRRRRDRARARRVRRAHDPHASWRSSPRRDQGRPSRPRGAQAPRRAHRHRDRPRRRDDQRHLHPHGHDRQRLHDALRRSRMPERTPS